jgi:hypothetical protein
MCCFEFTSLSPLGVKRMCCFEFTSLSPLGVKGMCCFEFTSLSPLGERGDRKAVGEGVEHWELSI